MPGIGSAERYVISRESNVVRVDFARKPDPPAPRFPGAGALRSNGGSGGLAEAVTPGRGLLRQQS
jgi:hypothetical protein